MDTEIKPKPVKARAVWDKRLYCWIVYAKRPESIMGAAMYSLRAHDTAVMLFKGLGGYEYAN